MANHEHLRLLDHETDRADIFDRDRLLLARLLRLFRICPRIERREVVPLGDLAVEDELRGPIHEVHADLVVGRSGRSNGG
jgi:hypothetical protein